MATGTGNLPNPGMSFTPFDILTAAEMNDLVENIESLATGTGIGDGSIGTSNIANTAVTSAKINLSTILELGYAEISTSITTTSTSPVAATGLAVTGITIPANVTKVKVELFIPRAQHNSGSNWFVGSIWDGDVGSGTRIADAPVFQAGTANSGGSLYISGYVSVTEGSTKTFRAGFYGTSSNTTTISVGSTTKAYIRVSVAK